LVALAASAAVTWAVGQREKRRQRQWTALKLLLVASNPPWPQAE